MSSPCISGTRLVDLEDDQLLEAAAAGDQQAFAQLVERHSPWLLHRAARIMRDEHLAQDIVQQVWVQLSRSLSILRSEGTLKAWLARVARNRCLDELRRKQPLTFSDLATEGEADEVLLLPDPAPLPEEVLEWHELQESVRAAIDTLPPLVQAVVLLRTQAQLTYDEIGQVLGVPISTTKAALFRARRRLRTMHQLKSLSY